MLLADAEKLALELMAQFGLIRADRQDSLPAFGYVGGRVPSDTNWRFHFDNAVGRFGGCHWNTRKITLSREMTLLNDREQVEDTIRHEIAHALCTPPIRVRGVKRDSHGEEWKRMCKRTGAKPERCYNMDTVERVVRDWSATCGGCGRVYYKSRRPTRDLWCGHKECRRANPPEYGEGRFNAICKLNFKHKNALPDPSDAQRKKAIEAMKARLRAQEPSMAASDSPSMPTESELTYQCVKCDRINVKSTSNPIWNFPYATCPNCGGDMMPESKLQAEKEQLKKRIAELERKVGK
jgi:predicted SprT family Zn-dependent metalloprotease